MMEIWWFTVGAHTILTGAYVWIAFILLTGNHRAHQWRSNPIATATFAIFLTCAIGHGLHVYHAFESALGISSTSTAAARIAMSDPLLMVWAMATALVAVWYLTMRSRLGIMSRGAPLCEDMQKQQERAAQMRGPIHAAIIRAETRLAVGDRDGARAALDEAMLASKHVVTALIGDADVKIRAGDLRRRNAA